MLSIFAILHIVKIVLLGMTLILGLLYISLILITHGLRTSASVLMANVCMTCILCTCFWIVYNLLEMTNSPLMRYDELCWFYSYAQNVSVCQVVYAFCAVSLNRYLIVVYSNNTYFKRRRWAMICAFIQWLIGALLPAPLWSSKVRTPTRWIFDILRLINRINFIPTVLDMRSVRYSMAISTVQSIRCSHRTYCFHRCTEWYLIHIYSQINHANTTDR